MTGIAGALNIQDSSRVRANTIGQDVLFEAAREYFQRVNEDVMSTMGVFVSSPTEKYTERYKLPGGGRMSQSGGYAPAPARKAVGYWDVAYPLMQFNDALAYTDVDLARMTIDDLQLQIDNIALMYSTEVRFQILRRLFKNTTDTFVDDEFGSLTIQPLANGDAVVYPPVVGATAEATEDHYLESGYAVSAISDSNNPAITIRNELVEHFGDNTGGSNIVMYGNYTLVDKLSGLTDFVPVPDNYIRPGANADIPERLPLGPGYVRGRLSGVWVVEWGHIPANYALGVHLEADAPLKMRVDEAVTGLPQGLNLVTTDVQYPWSHASYRARFGVGAGNRLNGVALEFGTGGTYSIPSDYS